MQQKINQLSKVKLRSLDLFESNELYESFSILLQEKDTLIAELITVNNRNQAAEIIQK